MHKQQYNIFGQQLHAVAVATALGSTENVIFVTTTKGIGIKSSTSQKNEYKSY